jgi:glutaredoxin
MIVLYTLPNCPKCQVVKLFLRRKGIDFEERDARDYSTLLLSHGLLEVPVIEINGQFCKFDTLTELEDILRREGYSI